MTRKGLREANSKGRSRSRSQSILHSRPKLSIGLKVSLNWNHSSIFDSLDLVSNSLISFAHQTISSNLSFLTRTHSMSIIKLTTPACFDYFFWNQFFRSYQRTQQGEKLSRELVAVHKLEHYCLA